MRPAADEGFVANYKRSGGIEGSGACKVGSDRRHISFHEHACTTGDSNSPEAAAPISETGNDACAEKSEGTGSAARHAKILRPFDGRRWLECGATRSGDPFRR